MKTSTQFYANHYYQYRPRSLILVDTDSYTDRIGFNDNIRKCGYSGPGLRPMQNSIGSVHILLISVSGSVNEPLVSAIPHGSFTLADSDTDSESMKFYCQCRQF